MNELSALLLVAAAAMLFYAIIPGIGAFSARAHWRLFRKRLQESSLLSFLQYSDLGKSAGAPGLLGNYRVFGDLEAIQGSHRIWINHGQFSVCVDLEGVGVYLLPSAAPSAAALPIENREESLPDEQPATVPWNQIFSLPAGTRMFVSGALFSEEGSAVFRSRPGQPLLVVLYDGDRATILQRATWGGRQRNEYWNQFTVASLLTGSFCMLLLAFVLLRAPMTRLVPLAALSLAFFPVAGLLPPGFLLYYLYRHFWKTGRRLRAERDMLRLPLRYYREALEAGGAGAPRGGDSAAAARAAGALTRLPTGEPYLMSADPDLLIRGEPAIRGAGLALAQADRSRRRGRRRGLPDQQAWPVLFGTPAWDPEAPPGPGAERWVGQPADPMAELVLVVDDPLSLAEACDRRARLFEFLAGACVLAALGLNHFLLLLVWNWLIR
jgi:hypothetical protein